ncbi:MAG: hypothetical protein U0573_15045 [Phycisphaerales bacterium]|nr:hypothetical protein [Planctomycetota bacterium]
MIENPTENPAPQVTELVSRPRFDWRAFFAHLTTFFSVVIILALGLGFLILRKPIREKAEQVVSREPARIVFEWPVMAQKDAKPSAPAKTWLAPQFQEELLTLATKAAGANPDPLSHAPLDAIGSALEKSGWFDGRPTVARVGQSEIVIKGAWRIPAAVVRVPGAAPGEEKDRLISWDGRPMPVEYPAGRSGLTALLGVGQPPAKDASGNIDFTAAWPGDDAAAGLELFRLIAGQPWHTQVAAIDVGGFNQDKQLSISTTYSTRLIWGGRPSKPLTGECSTAAKLAKISELNAVAKRIDAGHSEIELWWPINKPLEIDRSASAEQKLNTTASAEPARH